MKKITKVFAVTALVCLSSAFPIIVQAQSWTSLLPRAGQTKINTPADYSWPNPAENAMTILRARQQAEQNEAIRTQNEAARMDLEERQRRAAKAAREEQERQRATQEAAYIDKNFMERATKEGQTNPKILAALSDTSLPISPAMAEVIKRIEPGPKILSYLYDHREDARRIYRLPPLETAAELGMIAGKVAK